MILAWEEGTQCYSDCSEDGEAEAEDEAGGSGSVRHVTWSAFQEDCEGGCVGT